MLNDYRLGRIAPTGTYTELRQLQGVNAQVKADNTRLFYRNQFLEKELSIHGFESGWRVDPHASQSNSAVSDLFTCPAARLTASREGM